MHMIGIRHRFGFVVFVLRVAAERKLFRHSDDVTFGDSFDSVFCEARAAALLFLLHGSDRSDRSIGSHIQL
jgi:hypothetical protein